MILQRCTHPRPCYDDGKCHYKGECGHKAPLSNADRIRAMSDKELVRIRYSGAQHCKSDNPRKCNRHGFVDGMSPCEQCYYEWLQQPAEGAT